MSTAWPCSAIEQMQAGYHKKKMFNIFSKCAWIQTYLDTEVG